MFIRHVFDRRRALTGVLALPLLAAGCASVGPNYRRPDMQPPAAYRGQPAAAPPESLADVGWWQVFDDPALQTLIREGITNNIDLKVAAARVVEARALAGVAKSFLYPQANVGFNVVGEQISRLQDPAQPKDRVPDRTYQNWVLTGSVAWELDLFGGLRRGHEAAFAQYLATEDGRRAVLVSLVGDIASTYFLLGELDLQLDVARRTLKLNDDTVAYYTTRLGGGVSNRLEVDQAKANRAITAAAIPEIERQIVIAEDALSVLVGRPPGPSPRGRSIVEQKAPPRIPAGLPAQLLVRRPDVVQAERLLVAANADVGAAKAQFYPKIALTGSGGSVSGALADFMRPDAMVWSLAAGLLQPIYAGGRIKQNYEASKARYVQALGQYQQTALRSYQEVADSLVSIEKLGQQQNEYKVGVEALRDASQLSRSRYDTGLSTYLEVLIADQQLFQQELQYAVALGEQFRAFAQLYRSLGGGWQPEQPTQAPTVVK